MKVAVVGDLAVDIKGFYDGPIRPGKNVLLNNVKINSGGVAGNTAYYLRMFGDHAVVFGAVGNDTWGELLIKELSSLKVDTANIEIINGQPTGFFIIILNAKGERTMFGSRGANEELSVTEEELLNIKPDWVHLSGYSIMSDRKRKILEAVKKVASELNIHYSVDLEGVGEKNLSLKLPSAIVFCNKGYCMEKSRIGSKITIIKAGSSGCYLVQNGEAVRYEALKVRALDTTGAGDAFNAAFIHAYWKTKDAELACKFANVIAGTKVTKKGNKVKMPYKKILKYYGLS